MTKLKKLDKWLTAKKALYTFVATLIGIYTFVELMGGSSLNFETASKELLIAAVFGAVRAALNYRKHSSGAGLKGFLPLLLPALALGLVSCATTVRSEFTEIGPDGESTSYTAKSSAGPFGEIDTTLHTFSYKISDEENLITVGQDAVGMSNAGQVQAFVAAIEALAPILNTVAIAAGNYMEIVAAQPPPAPVLSPLVIPGR